MGFSLGGILKGIGKVGGLVAAPFTGGASAALTAGLGAADAIGSALGGAGEGAAQGRFDENNFRILNNRNILDRDFGIADRDLQRRQFQESAPSGRLDQARSADRVLNRNAAFDAIQPFELPSGATTRGLPDPNALGRVSDETGELAELIRGRALTAQQSGDQFDPIDPQLAGIKQPGAMEKIGNIGGVAGGIAGGINNILKDSRASKILEEQMGGILKPIPAPQQNIRVR